MEQSSSWKTISHSASQETARLLWIPKVHYSDHNSPPLVRILRQRNPVHTFPSYFPKRSIIILSSPDNCTYIHLRLGLTSGLFPSGFPTTIIYAFLIPTLHATCPKKTRHETEQGYVNFSFNTSTLIIRRFGLTFTNKQQWTVKWWGKEGWYCIPSDRNTAAKYDFRHWVKDLRR